MWLSDRRIAVCEWLHQNKNIDSSKEFCKNYMLHTTRLGLFVVRMDSQILLKLLSLNWRLVIMASANSIWEYLEYGLVYNISYIKTDYWFFYTLEFAFYTPARSCILPALHSMTSSTLLCPVSNTIIIKLRLSISRISSVRSILWDINVLHQVNNLALFFAQWSAWCKVLIYVCTHLISCLTIIVCLV